VPATPEDEELEQGQSVVTFVAREPPEDEAGDSRDPAARPERPVPKKPETRLSFRFFNGWDVGLMRSLNGLWS
jgi:hypothetical protein